MQKENVNDMEVVSAMYQLIFPEKSRTEIDKLKPSICRLDNHYPGSYGAGNRRGEQPGRALTRTMTYSKTGT